MLHSDHQKPGEGAPDTVTAVHHSAEHAGHHEGINHDLVLNHLCVALYYLMYTNSQSLLRER